MSGEGAPDALTADSVTITDVPALFGIEGFDFGLGDGSGGVFSQAGGRPESVTSSFDITTDHDPDVVTGMPVEGDLSPVEPLKDAVVDLPPGVVGNPTVASRCALPDLANSRFSNPQPLCAPTSQVGTVMVRVGGQGETNLVGPIPVFNLIAPRDAPARLAFNVYGSVVVLDARLRSDGDYGITVGARNASEGLRIVGTTFRFWGVPSDPSHTPERACPGDNNPWYGGLTCESGAERLAFLRNTTSCADSAGGSEATLRAASWTDPTDVKTATVYTHKPLGFPFPVEDWGARQGPTGCESVPFDPSVSAGPVPGRAGGPSGLSFDLSVPQNDDPASVGQSDLRRAVVTLPEGVRVSPSSG